MYNAAISGTTVSVILAIRSIPPRNINNATIAIKRPMIHCGTPNAVWNADAIELDCTAFPIKPRAKMISTAKMPAKTFPKDPLNAALI